MKTHMMDMKNRKPQESFGKLEELTLFVMTGVMFVAVMVFLGS